MKLGERIRMMRVQKGLTQWELAKMLGKTNACISGYETGKIQPSFSTINVIADALGVQASELLAYAAGENESSDDAEIQTSKRTRRVKRILCALDMLNDEGQKKLIEIAEQLCLIQIYTNSIAGSIIQYLSVRHRQTFTLDKDEEVSGVYDEEDTPTGGRKWNGRHMVFCSRVTRGYAHQWDFFYHTFDGAPDNSVIRGILKDEAVSDGPGSNIAFALDDKAVYDRFIDCYMELNPDYGTEFDVQRDEVPVLFVLLDKETWTIKESEECDLNETE